MPTYNATIHTQDGIIRQRCAAWQAEIHAGGKRRRKTFDTLPRAKVWLQKTRLQIRRDGLRTMELTDRDRLDLVQAKQMLGDIPLLTAVEYYTSHHPTAGITVPELYQEFLAVKTKAGLRPRSLQSIRYKIGTLAREMPSTAVAAVTPGILDAWLDKTTTTPQTRRDLITHATVLFNYAIRAGYIAENPAVRLERPRVDQSTTEIFPVTDVERLLITAFTQFRALVPWLAVGFFAGLRTAELDGLRWKDVDTDARLIRVTPETAKKRRQRHVTIPDVLAAWLAPYHKKNRLAPPYGTRRKVLDALLKKSGVAWIHNGMRHSFATYHLTHHGDPGRTALELGHAGSQAILFDHYRGLTTREDAARFWAIMPPTSPVQNPPR